MSYSIQDWITDDDSTSATSTLDKRTSHKWSTYTSNLFVFWMDKETGFMILLQFISQIKLFFKKVLQIIKNTFRELNLFCTLAVWYHKFIFASESWDIMHINVWWYDTSCTSDVLCYITKLVKRIIEKILKGH